jgi:chaperonin GroES
MLKPLNDQVILQKPEGESQTTTSSGIVLTADKDERQVIATVLAVGPGKLEDGKRLEMGVKVGDKVVFKSYASTDVTLDENHYLIVKESDILAIVEA